MTGKPTVDEVMERASRVLVDRDYVGCELLCLEALRLSEAAGDWAMVAAIVLPLQEARRQRRIVATEGVLRIGEPSEGVWPGAWTGGEVGQAAGWWVETGEASVERVSGVRGAMRAAGVMGEVMSLAERHGAWWARGTATDGRVVETEVAAPRREWLGGEMGPGDGGHEAAGGWLIEASEALGDAAIAAVVEPMGSVERVRAVRGMLGVFDDHEKLHQAWATAARAVDAASIPAGGGS